MSHDARRSSCEIVKKYLEETRFGFVWNDVRVERVCEDDKIGTVIRISSDISGKWVDVYASPAGRKLRTDEGRYDTAHVKRVVE